MLYRTVIVELIELWRTDDDYSHGILVPFFCAFLVWQRRDRLRVAQSRGDALGLPVLLLGLALLVVGEPLGVNTAARVSLVVVLAGIILFHFGRDVFKTLALPLFFFLLFAGPLNHVFFVATVPLQRLAARGAAVVLDLVGTPVLLDGNIIHLSRISLGVTEACSGIRSLVSLLALAVAWAALTMPGMWGASLLIAAAVPITVIANAGRVVATGLIAQWFGPDYARGFFHAFSGWVIFVLALTCLLALDRLTRALTMRRRDHDQR
jgi:exosortase